MPIQGANTETPGVYDFTPDGITLEGGYFYARYEFNAGGEDKCPDYDERILSVNTAFRFSNLGTSALVDADVTFPNWVSETVLNAARNMGLSPHPHRNVWWEGAFPVSEYREVIEKLAGLISLTLHEASERGFSMEEFESQEAASEDTLGFADALASGATVVESFSITGKSSTCETCGPDFPEVNLMRVTNKGGTDYLGVTARYGCFGGVSYTLSGDVAGEAWEKLLHCDDASRSALGSKKFGKVLDLIWKYEKEWVS